ncbi:MAG: HEAT repeat domain-containing protein, partial [Myxococcota bacterium]
MLEVALVAAAFVVVIFMQARNAAQYERSVRDNFADAASRLRFAVAERESHLPRIRGEVRGAVVEVDLLPSQVKGDGYVPSMVRIRVLDADLTRDLAFGAETYWSQSGLEPDREALTLDDPDFDELVKVRGSEAAALALLDADTRELLTQLVRGGGYYAEGRLSSEGNYLEDMGWDARRPPERESSLLKHIHPMVELADRLRRSPEEDLERIAANARSDPKEAVRKRNLVYLTTHASGTEVARDAVRAALEDPSSGVRLWAARRVEDARVPTLIDVARDESAEPGDRLEALDEVVQDAAEAEILDLLSTLLLTANLRVRQVALKHARTREVPSLRERAEACLTEEDEGLLVAAVGALGQVGTESTLPLLAGLLEDPRLSVRIAASEALGRIGTIDEVPELLTHAEGVFTDAGLRRAASNAVAAIQARAGHPDAGRLAIMEPTAP